MTICLVPRPSDGTGVALVHREAEVSIESPLLDDESTTA